MPKRKYKANFSDKHCCHKVGRSFRMFVFETLASIRFLSKKGFQETLQSQYVPS